MNIQTTNTKTVEPQLSSETQKLMNDFAHYRAIIKVLQRDPNVPECNMTIEGFISIFMIALPLNLRPKVLLSDLLLNLKC
jgi:hypothetical protein